MREQLNCPNCGAPITGFKCEYCGTQFFDLADIEMNKRSYLRMKIGNGICTMCVIPVNAELEFRPRERSIVNIEMVIVPDETGAVYREVRI